MAKDIFVVGIGGTGMRCLENTIHLCAMGMYDETTVHMLALDTDTGNGNMKRVEELVEKYNRINNSNAKNNTFFSADIKFYKFGPNYDSNTTFSTISRYGNQAQALPEDEMCKATDIVDLFITPDTRDMNLKHGYRAQTQMGSILIYHAIIYEAMEVMNDASRRSGLKDFINALTRNGVNQQVFVFGSVFGGTGASTIPVLPKALNEAARIMTGNDQSDIEGNYFGSVVLTSYFNFAYKKSGEKCADPNNFALNSQAALMFYNKDKTVTKAYKRFYLIGRDSTISLEERNDRGGLDTGGENQKNPVDYIELLAAFAAYDFFKCCDKSLSGNEDVFKIKVDNDESQFFFRAIEDSAKRLEFDDFTEEDHEKFKKKLGIFTAMAIDNKINDFIKNRQLEYFTEIKDNDLEPLQGYLDLFYDVKNHTGWMQQLYNSASLHYTDGLLLNKEIFNKDADSDKLEFNKKLYVGENPPSFKEKSSLFGSKKALIHDPIAVLCAEKQQGKNKTISGLLETLYSVFDNLYFPH